MPEQLSPRERQTAFASDIGALNERLQSKYKTGNNWVVRHMTYDDFVDSRIDASGIDDINIDTPEAAELRDMRQTALNYISQNRFLSAVDFRIPYSAEDGMHIFESIDTIIDFYKGRLLENVPGFGVSGKDLAIFKGGVRLMVFFE